MSLLNLSLHRMRKFIDICANLTDPMFDGIYNGSKKHDNDLNEVLARAKRNGLERIIVAGTSYESSCMAISISNDPFLNATVGCHPTHCMEIHDQNLYFEQMSAIIEKHRNKIIAVGECGLDYERLQFCPKEIQKRNLIPHFDLAERYHLPMLLHNRNSTADLIEILRRHRDRFPGGVVHSFDGTIEEAKAILDLDLYIGINGCSLKTKNNLDVMAAIPADRLLIETDSPWCEIRPSHAGAKYLKTKFPTKKKDKFVMGTMIKNRNEPAMIIQVLEVMATHRNVDQDELADVLYKNSIKLFFS